MTERWMPVPGFSDYAVSDLGRVKRIVPDRKNHSCRTLVSWRGNHQYETVGLSRDGKLFRRLVHRLVCEAFHGSPPTPDHQVAHNDGTRHNNRADNLRWATRAENMTDCVAHGTRAAGESHGRKTKPERTPRGEQHGHAKIGERDVLDIRAAPRAPGSGVALAAKYGISPSTICLIRAGKIWTHIAGRAQA
jgi:hypothetical protein